ncbi:MAG: hypothetical protein ACPHY8_06520, partial [Patescibacteria group bacterium]
ISNQEIIDLSGSSQEFYTKNIKKITPKISEEFEKIEDNYEEIILEENKIVPIENPKVEYKDTIEVTFL